MKFHGTKSCMPRWAEVVQEVTGKVPGPVVEQDNDEGRKYGFMEFDIDLTADDRELLMSVWYVKDKQPSNTSNFPWNYRVSFSE